MICDTLIYIYIYNECIATILVLRVAVRKYFLPDENTGKEFMIPETYIISWILEKNVICWFALKWNLGYGYSLCTDKYPHNVTWDLWNKWEGSFDNKYQNYDLIMTSTSDKN